MKSILQGLLDDILGVQTRIISQLESLPVEIIERLDAEDQAACERFMAMVDRYSGRDRIIVLWDGAVLAHSQKFHMGDDTWSRSMRAIVFVFGYRRVKRLLLRASKNITELAELHSAVIDNSRPMRH